MFIFRQTSFNQSVLLHKSSWYHKDVAGKTSQMSHQNIYTKDTTQDSMGSNPEAWMSIAMFLSL